MNVFVFICFYFVNSLTSPVHKLLMQRWKEKPNTHKLSELSKVCKPG